MKHIFYCAECSKYTMKDVCSCGKQAITTKPARYTPVGYGKYRREARREELAKKGLI